ncbi:MAG: carboxypeptidase regulatory-like domain-containing protein [Holophagales bacterium]|nr:carboxypeptidase regulatory-like domain-containing protein [Holophagales bacterium]MYH26218.1 carboxypeptidase regulatory-like domain-containing protein [Holophagales bacterium]
MTIGRLLLALAVVLTAAAPAPAQEWSGSNGFRVVVTDDAGQPLPGVTVMVLLAEPDRSGGPPPLLTDASGVAEVSGLSAGEWQVELRREGFMIVSSYLRLEDGKRPQVGFTSRQRTGPFWAPMNVGYSSVGGATTTASAGSARALTRAQRRAERRAEQRERRLRRENVARIVEPPAPREAPVEEPAQAAVAEAEVEPGEQAPAPVETSAPVETPAAQPAAVAEQPAPDPPVEERPAVEEPEPAPEPEPEPVAVRLLPNRTLLRAGACPECGPGEWSVASNWPAAPRTAETVACAPDLAERMERVAKIVEASLPADFRVYAGSLAEPTGNDVLRLLPDGVRTEVQELLLSILDPERSCQVMGIFLPADARFVGFQYEAADLQSRGSCLPDQPCEIGEAGWRGNPVIHRLEHGTFVYGVFENQSSQRRREGNFKVYFRPPRGWLPPR